MTHFFHSLVLVSLLSSSIYISNAGAETIIAKSGTQPDLQRAVNSAAIGDTVQIPAGTFPFKGTVRFNAGITLQGMGESQTILAKADSATTTALIDIDGTNGLSVTISAITFIGVDNQTTELEDNGLRLKHCKDFRVFNCTFRRFGFSGLYIRGACRGVVDHCKFIENFRLPINNLGYGVVIYGNGDESWERPLELGTENAVFVEDCYFERCRHSVASNNGSNYVFRYNTIKDNYPWAAIDAHGYSSSPRGSRSYEIYRNTINGGVNPDGTRNESWRIGIRGGDGVIFDNTFSSKKSYSLIGLTIDRVNDQHSNYPQPDQTTDLWLWDNTQGGSPLTKLRHGWNAEMEELFAPYLQEGRDFHFAQKPDYRPFTYPHPLIPKGSSAIATFKQRSVPSGLELSVNASNSYRISFSISLGHADDYSLEVYNIRGQQLWRYNAAADAGKHLVTWDLSATGNNRIANGVYFGILKMGGNMICKNFAVVR